MVKLLMGANDSQDQNIMVSCQLGEIHHLILLALQKKALNDTKVLLIVFGVDENLAERFTPSCNCTHDNHYQSLAGQAVEALRNLQVNLLSESKEQTVSFPLKNFQIAELEAIQDKCPSLRIIKQQNQHSNYNRNTRLWKENREHII